MGFEFVLRAVGDPAGVAVFSEGRRMAATFFSTHQSVDPGEGGRWPRGPAAYRAGERIRESIECSKGVRPLGSGGTSVAYKEEIVLPAEWGWLLRDLSWGAGPGDRSGIRSGDSPGSGGGCASGPREGRWAVFLSSGIDAGPAGSSWCVRFPRELAERYTRGAGDATIHPPSSRCG